MVERRPPGVDRKTWREQRDRVWARRHRVFNVVMVIAIGFVVLRYCSQLG
ncbi:MAG: hypothetical protein V3T14_07785 [Myxococcota bacterium]